VRAPSRTPGFLALAAALLGLATGAGVRYSLGGTAGRTWVASLEASVVDVQLDPAGAHAVVDVTLLTSEPSVTVTRGFATGAGIARGDRQVPLTLVPRPDADRRSPLVQQTRVTMPLHCDDTATTTAEPGRITLAVTTTSGARHEVSGPTGSGLNTPPDLCSFAAGVLPAGWEQPVAVGSFTPDPADPRTARLTVSGFAPGSQVVASFATTSPFADLFTVEQPDSRGTVVVTVHLTDGCQDDGAPLPVGLTLSVATTPGSRTYHYAGVGAPMARWILDYRTTRCPS